jgi:hypothetical protein
MEEVGQQLELRKRRRNGIVREGRMRKSRGSRRRKINNLSRMRHCSNLYI